MQDTTAEGRRSALKDFIELILAKKTDTPYDKMSYESIFNEVRIILQCF